jgi:hypothetical protein
MSATETTTIRPSALSAALQDYSLHHSGVATAEGEQHTITQERVENPPNWDYTHRRVPPYRPVDTRLDQSQRRVYHNRAEQVFISVMFAGVLINAVCLILWRTFSSSRH